MATILIIDDHDQIREMLAESLSSAGHQVHQAEDGKVGVEQFRRVTPDLVIIDIIMPVQDGIETLRILLDEPHHPPVIALSGGGMSSPDNYLKVAGKLGASRTFAKPIPLSDLHAAVDELLGAQG